MKRSVVIHEVPFGERCRLRHPRYVLCDPVSGRNWTVFGLLQGGDTRAEVVFWAERLADKNDLTFVRPDGWEGVVGRLPLRSWHDNLPAVVRG